MPQLKRESGKGANVCGKFRAVSSSEGSMSPSVTVVQSFCGGRKYPIGKYFRAKRSIKSYARRRT